MAWKPEKGGPRTLRELYHWAYNNFLSVGTDVGTPNPAVVHADTTSRSAANSHPTSAITDLDSAQASQDAAINARTLAGYGSIQLSTPTGVLVNTGWNAIPADSSTLATPLNVSYDAANNGLAMNVDGVWQISAYLSLDHNESNGGRELFVRLYNATTDTPVGDGIRVAVGRNQPGSNATVIFLADITEAAGLSDTFQLQVGGTSDSFSSVIVDDYTLSVNHIGIV